MVINSLPDLLKASSSNINQDLHLLVADMSRARLHIATMDRSVYAPEKINKETGVTTLRGAIVDYLDTGAQVLREGKFNEFTRTTTYPLDREVNARLTYVFDQTNANPISTDEYEDNNAGDD